MAENEVIPFGRGNDWGFDPSRRTTNVRFRSGVVARTQVRGHITGGPFLALQLSRLTLAMMVTAAKEAVTDGLTVIADDWQDRVPVDEGNYREAVSAPTSVKVGKTVKGATGTVAPRHVPGLPDNEQPYLYAARLEFGDDDRTPQPSARPAFDHSRDDAVDAVEDRLRGAVAKIVVPL